MADEGRGRGKSCANHRCLQCLHSPVLPHCLDDSPQPLHKFVAIAMLFITQWRQAMSIYHDFKFHLSSEINLCLKVYISRARLPAHHWRPAADGSALLRCPPDATYVTAQVRVSAAACFLLLLFDVADVTVLQACIHAAFCMLDAPFLLLIA